MSKLSIVFLTLMGLLHADQLVIDGQAYAVVRHAGADQYTEELVAIPEGATAAEYADQAVPIHTPPAVEDRRRISWLSLHPGPDGRPYLALNIEFGEFKDLLSEPRYYEVLTADTGESELRPARRPGILATTGRLIQENPGKTLLGTALALDLAYDGRVSVFGLLGSKEGGSGTTVQAGDNSQVTVIIGSDAQNDNSDSRDQSSQTEGN